MNPKTANGIVTTMGIDIGKNTFHLIGTDARGTIVLRQKLSRGQVEVRLANMPHNLSPGQEKMRPHRLCRPFGRGACKGLTVPSGRRKGPDTAVSPQSRRLELPAFRLFNLFRIQHTGAAC